MSDKKDKSNKNVVSDKRNTSLKWYSIGSVLLLIAIVLVVNILFDSILGKKLSFDFSATGQNSVSDITESYLASLPSDTNVRIVGLFDRPSNIKDTPLEYIVPLLDSYEAKSGGKITVQYINPKTYPTIISELDTMGVYDLAEDMYVVECGGKIITVDPYNCFTYDQEYMQYGYYIPTGNIAESTFTNAIVNLTRGYTSKAYFVTGLQEPTHTQFSRLLDALGTESVDLLASDDFSIPDDCDLLIINGINSDITESMAVAMEDYLNAGGKMIVAVNYTASNINEQFIHLNEVLHVMNLNIDPYLVLENNTAYQMNNSNITSLLTIDPQYASFTNDQAVRSGYARPVREFDNPYSYIKVSPVLYTSDSATANVVDSQGQATQYANQGRYTIAYYSTFTGMTVPPEVYVFGTMYFTSDEYISQYGFNNGNVEFVRSIIRSLLKADDSVIVPAKALSDYSIDATKVTGNAVSMMMAILLVVVPLAFVICGTVVYNRRKNL